MGDPGTIDAVRRWRGTDAQLNFEVREVVTSQDSSLYNNLDCS